MKHVPQTIWLNVGEADEIDTNDFRELDNELITWCEHKLGSGDIKYVRDRIVKQRQKKQDESILDRLNELRKLHSGGLSDRELAFAMLDEWQEELEQKLKK